MYSTHLLSSLADVHIDDLRRSRAASRPHRSRLLASPVDRGSRDPRANLPTTNLPTTFARAFAARFAH